MALTADAGIDEGWRQRLRSRSAHHREELADPRLDQWRRATRMARAVRSRIRTIFRI
jgi:hypothetical protein